jgi:hypothetical protein
MQKECEDEGFKVLGMAVAFEYRANPLPGFLSPGPGGTPASAAVGRGGPSVKTEVE